MNILIGKLRGRRPLGRHRSGRENNSRIYLKVIGVDARNRIDSAQSRDY